MEGATDEAWIRIRFWISVSSFSVSLFSLSAFPREALFLEPVEIAMVPLDPAALAHVRSWVGEPSGRGVLDLHHALEHHDARFRGDEARAPRSVLLIRERAGQADAYGAGEPEPAVSEIVRRRGRPVALLAPEGWWDAVESRLEARSVAVSRVEMRTLAAGHDEFTPATSVVATRRLALEDAAAFLTSEAVPDWALACWGEFATLVAHGAAFGVPLRAAAGYAALAWVYGQAGRYEAVGVSTTARFRRLGLGRAAASALVAHIIEERGKLALWTAGAGNAASLALGRSLGFSDAGTETYLRWQPAADTWVW
jgi:hypothetical protein